jgi:DNA-binding MarR family transcriptional regulator
MPGASDADEPMTELDESQAEGPSEYRVDQQIGFFLRQANQRHVSIFTSRMGDRLTTTQWAALSKLKEIQPTSQNQLGRETAMDVATIKGVVDRLVARDFIQSAPDPNDGRRLILSLAAEGEAALSRNLATARSVTEETLSPLTSGERMMLIELLTKIC